MILPFHVTIATTNTPKNLFSTTDNLILASMIASSNNTIAAFGLGGLPNGANFLLTRIKVASATAGIVLAGVYNGTNFYQIYETIVTDTQYTANDDDLLTKYKAFNAQDGIFVPQSSTYNLCLKLAAAPGGNVDLAGFIQIAPWTSSGVPALV